ncbi:MAG TPA: response regulator transcription factor [Labilithrix sp.]|nr:response regulator transcription factor [Labilithrix sp.]
MGRVLVIDGDAARRVALATALGAGAHDVEMASAAATGTHIARVSRPDLVIVESLLPDGSSAEVLGTLRRDPLTARTLVLVVGATGDETDRVVAFECGADDYVTRPFSLRELLLRVRALLRRTRAATPDDMVALGPVRIDRGTRRVTVDGVAVALTRRELDLLLRLFDSRGRVLARETIVADVWREEAASQRVVDTTLKRLRRKLPMLARQIRTIRGIGYELTVDEVLAG